MADALARGLMLLAGAVTGAALTFTWMLGGNALLLFAVLFVLAGVLFAAPFDLLLAWVSRQLGLRKSQDRKNLFAGWKQALATFMAGLAGGAGVVFVYHSFVEGRG